jgi:hypothetical protein
MKKISTLNMVNIKGGFNWHDFFYGACQGFTAVGVFATPIGVVRVLSGAANIGCLSLS